MPNDLIRYDILVQEALCGVVKKVLAEVARHGLPGEHHFYITFRTHAPGVRLSSRMREQYPEEMTIILQHQFEDLKVTDYAFEVGLSFKGVPELLMIPFEALTGFFDPSVQFSAKFEPQPEAEGETGEIGAGPSTVTMLPGPRALPAPLSVSAPSLVAPSPAPTSPKANTSKPGPSKPSPVTSSPVAPVAPALSSVPKIGKATPQAPKGLEPEPVGAQQSDPTKVVSIDSFRKKP